MRFKSWRAPLRGLSIGVLATVLAMTVALSLSMRSVVADQQRRLLSERAAEAGLVAGSLFQGAASALPTLATVAPVPGSTARFSAAARSDLGVVGGIGALRQAGGTFSVLAGVGAAPGPGASVSAGQVALARRALGAKGL
ncbi:MAG: hypothetical protein ACYCZV_17905, partial [Acidimicrobiales bacterium]